jgi:hypothetical protein
MIWIMRALPLLVLLTVGRAGAAWADEAAALPLERFSFEATPTPPLTLEVPHPFGRAFAHERIVQLLNYWHARFGVSSQWRGDQVFITGEVFGVVVKALLEITDSCVQAVANDPGLVWRGTGVSYVERKLKKYLHPTYDEPE